MHKLINEIRFLCFMSGVLHQQQSDPLCKACKAFENTAARLKDDLSGLEELLASGSGPDDPEIRSMATAARRRLDELKIPEGAVGQKKAGRCRMPEGVCFIKYSKAIRDRI